MNGSPALGLLLSQSVQIRTAAAWGLLQYLLSNIQQHLVPQSTPQCCPRSLHSCLGAHPMLEVLNLWGNATAQQSSSSPQVRPASAVRGATCRSDYTHMYMLAPQAPFLTPVQLSCDSTHQPFVGVQACLMGTRAGLGQWRRATTTSSRSTSRLLTPSTCALLLYVLDCGAWIQGQVSLEQGCSIHRSRHLDRGIADMSLCEYSDVLYTGHRLLTAPAAALTISWQTSCS